MAKFKTRYYRQPGETKKNQPQDNSFSVENQAQDFAAETPETDHNAQPPATSSAMVPLVAPAGASPEPQPKPAPTITPLSTGYNPYELASQINALPQMQQISQNNEDIERLRQIEPTDQDGRWMSAWKALQTGLIKAFDPRFAGQIKNWGDIGSRLAYVGGSAAGGAISPEWNELSARDLTINQKIKENERLMGDAKNLSVMQDRQIDNQRQANGQKDKLEIEAARQANRIKLITERDKLQGQKYSIQTLKDGTGRLIKKFADHQEFFYDENNEQLINPFEISHKIKTEGGQEIEVKGSQILSNETAEKWRQAGMDFNETKLNSGIADGNNDDDYDYRKTVNEVDAKIAGANNKIKRLKQKVQSLQNAQYKEEVEEKNKAERELGEAEDSLAEFQAQKSGIPKRTKRQPISAPSVTRNKTVSPAKDPLGLFR